MTTTQTLQEAPNGAIWSRRVGDVTYFLRKINNTYEVWTSQASGDRATVSIGRAVTYYDQHNLVNRNTAAATTPPPRTPPPQPPPAPRPAPERRPAPVPANTPSPPPVNTPAPVPTPAPVADPNTIALPDVEVQGTRVESLLQGNGITGARQNLATQATAQDQANFDAAKDWRVRLALAPGANYLYAADDPGILAPLSQKTGTDGVIFPYTPQIAVVYSANYNPQDITHSNYKTYQYSNSSVDSVGITCDFTCQDVFEANYLLAVIHFFRSMTKMFYGQDNNPKNGTPPPLCYIYGLGGYQFDALPLAIYGFTYNLPIDVDYISTTGPSPAGSTQPTLSNNNTNGSANFLSGAARLLGINVGPGGTPRPPTYPSTPSSITKETTWVPTKIQLSINCYPVQSRNMVSNRFSLQDYATGKLLRGSQNPGGGMW